MTALRLSFSWLTILPITGPSEVDRRTAGRAIALAPVVGAALGGLVVFVLWALHPAGAVAGFAAVAALALGTRGMHLDGLADTFDGLGTYGSPERAREVMKSGGAGPFGVAAIVFAVGIQALAFAELAVRGHWFAVVGAVVLGRIAVVAACRRGTEPAPGTWFGGMVAGTQSRAIVVAWIVAGTALAVCAVPGLPWAGPLVTVAAPAVAIRLTGHAARRIGGLSGDLLGAAVEITTTVTALAFAALSG